ncbi:MAG TPA: metalloregulator ArsR/SmtB family transcription factor [Candidatus Limnocylindria bacterium]|nr:metalloregulator ArsR/SmtB family transcription factor [Candidatus Limnocylindria bacterium]
MELTADRCETECLHPELVRPLLGKVVGATDADDLAAIFELLADPTRARLLHALALTDELCVCDLALLLERSESALSHQLRMLRDRRVVSRRKAGRVVYYRLADRHIRHVLADGVRHVREAIPQRDRATG